MQEKAQEIKISDNLPGGEYTNFMQIANPNRDEFLIIFASLAGLSGKVVSKIITNPGHFKKMASLMNDMVKKYEEKYGIIIELPDIGKDVGYKE